LDKRIQRIHIDTTINLMKGQEEEAALRLWGGSGQQLWRLTDKAAVALAKRRGGGVGSTTQQRATITMDNAHNNQTEHGTGWMKMAAAMATMVGLVNAKVQWWMLWVGWPWQEEEGGNHEGDGGT
jgi:hypothetical protein